MKEYVEVTAKFDTDGNITPLVVRMEEGKFYVDRVYDVRPAASLKSGGAGIRYKCSVNGVMSYLFLEETKWFIEPAV